MAKYGAIGFVAAWRRLDVQTTPSIPSTGNSRASAEQSRVEQNETEQSDEEGQPDEGDDHDSVGTGGDDFRSGVWRR